MKKLLFFFLAWGMFVPKLAAMTRGEYALGGAALTIEGGASMNFYGKIAAGDVNGDRIKDLVSAANQAGSGALYVFYGKVTYPSSLSVNDADFKVYGSPDGFQLGFNIAVGDLNGDHIDDIVAAHAGTNNGAFIFWGRKDLPTVWDTNSTPPDADVILPPVAIMSAGIGTAIGDVNNDGINDLIIGLPDGQGPNNARATASGQVYVLLGRRYDHATPWSGTINMTNTNLYDRWIIYGAEVGDQCGMSVAAGDITNDGVTDILLEASRADGPNNTRPSAGEIYVVAGSTGDTFGSIATVSGSASPWRTLNYTAPFNWWAPGGGYTGAFVGAQFKIISGPQADQQVRTVIGNNDTTITLDTPLSADPTGKAFQIRVVDTQRGEQTLTIYGKDNSAGTLGVATRDVNQDGVSDILFTHNTQPGGVFQHGDIVCYFGRAHMGTSYCTGADAPWDIGSIGDTSHGSWSTNQFAGYWVKIISGTGAGQQRLIASNTATRLQVSIPWTVPPSSDSDFIIAALDLANGDPTESDEPNIVIYGTSSQYLGLKSLIPSDINGDGWNDIFFASGDDKSYAIFSKPLSVYDHEAHTLANGLASNGYDLRITGAGGFASASFPIMAGGDLNGDGSSNELIVAQPNADSHTGALYLFHDIRVPTARMTITVPGKTVTKKFIDQFRIQPDGSLGDQLSTKVESQ